MGSESVLLRSMEGKYVLYFVRAELVVYHRPDHVVTLHVVEVESVFFISRAGRQ